jgi:hypothetical protein
LYFFLVSLIYTPGESKSSHGPELVTLIYKISRLLLLWKHSSLTKLAVTYFLRDMMMCPPDHTGILPVAIEDIKKKGQR